MSNIIVHGSVKIPNGFKEVEYGECGGDWIPETFIVSDDIKNINWVNGTFVS